MDGEKSTFIKIDRFEDVITAVSIIKKKLAEAQLTLEKINSLKQEEDSAAQKWADDLASVQNKIQNIETELLNEEH